MAIDKIKTLLIDKISKSQAPILMWSGGKDSTLLLDILYSENLKIPVLMFHHFWSKEQLENIKLLFNKYKPQIFFYSPLSLSVKEDSLLINYYIGGKVIPAIMDHIHSDKYCGVDIGNKAISDSSIQPKYLWDLTIVGTKKSDIHTLINGNISFEEANSKWHEFYCPLEDFTDDQVLKECKKRNILLDKRVYEEDIQEYDTGNFIGCLKCVKHAGQVYCPKDNRIIDSKIK